MGDPRGRASGSDRSVPEPRRGVVRGKFGGHPEDFVLFGRRRRRPWRLAQPVPSPGGGKGQESGRIKRTEVAQQGLHGRRGRSVAGFAHGGVPAAGQALTRPFGGRLAKQVVDRLAQDDRGQLALDGVGQRVLGSDSGGQGRQRPTAGVIERCGKVRCHETTKRGQEGDRGGLGQGQPIELVPGQASDPLHHDGHELRGRRGSRRAVAPGAGISVPPVAAVRAIAPATCSLGTEPAGLVVMPAQRGIAQPVVGDVDPFGQRQTLVTGHIRVMAPQETPPGDLDGLRAGIVGHAQGRVQVIGGDGRASWHGPANASGPGRSRFGMLRVPDRHEPAGAAMARRRRPE